MRKKELLKHIPENMPEAMTAEIIKDGKEKVLMIIAPEAQVRTTAKHYGDAGFVHFTSKDRYLTYYPKSGTWSSESFDWIERNSYLWSTREDNDITKTVRDFGKEIGQKYAYSISSLESRSDGITRISSPRENIREPQFIFRMSHRHFREVLCSGQRARRQ